MIPPEGNSSTIEEYNYLLFRELRAWNEELQKREDWLLNECKAQSEKKGNTTKHKQGRRRREGHEYISEMLNEEQREWLRLRTKEIHASENIGTSNRLLYLMIVMRDVGFLCENIDITGFLRLMVEWEILDGKVLESKSVCNGMDYIKERLPDRGKRCFRNWTEAYARKDKEYCEHLAALLGNNPIFTTK